MELNPAAVAIQAAVDGNLRLLKKMASKIDLREAKGDHGGGWNLLHFAAVKGRLEVCRFLVEESGLDVNSTTSDGGTPVAHAAATGMGSVLRYLLDQGGDPVMPDTMGTTPLHNAADGGHCEAIALLLSRGVDVDSLNSRLITPLDLAAGEGHDQAVKVLLEHGADFNRIAHKTFAPLMMACCAGSLKCIKLLVEAGADVNFKSPYGPSPLLAAVMDGSTNIVRFLLEAGADPNISNEYWRYPIVHAACKGRRDLVEILFPHTKPIALLPNWSVDGIITTTDSLPSRAKEGLMGRNIPADAKPRGNEAFAKGDYLAATNFYEAAMLKDPLDPTLYANRSLCWLHLGDGEQALLDAQQCKIMRPRWSKAWYREGAALRLLKNYNGAASMFMEALKLDPANEEIKRGLRETIEAMRSAARSKEQNS
ncbi:unnamed protein product [Urochloa decumbens]|uniref:Uncharacterized protein n=1 Tax=Urochloa decumbens TaxID=240449 RepID=A0ABC8VXB9_9POAL